MTGPILITYTDSIGATRSEYLSTVTGALQRVEELTDLGYTDVALD